MPVIVAPRAEPRVVVVERRSATGVSVERTRGTIHQTQRQVAVAAPTSEAVAVATPGPQGKPGARGADGAGQVPPVPFGWGDAPRSVFVAPAAGILTIVRIQFTDAFDDTAAQVQVGTFDRPAAAMPAEYNAPASTLEFENSPDLALWAGAAVWLEIRPGASTRGAGLLFLTFLPTE